MMFKQPRSIVSQQPPERAFLIGSFSINFQIESIQWRQNEVSVRVYVFIKPFRFQK